MKTVTPQPSLLDWRRPVRDETAVSRRWTWLSKCGRFKVERHVPLLRGDDERWYALRYEPVPLNNFWILSIHRKRKAAFAACVRAARRS